MLIQDDGQLKPFGEAEGPNSDILATCDTSSCAIRKAAGWEGPEMSCYCRDHKGRWKLSTVDLSEYNLAASRSGEETGRGLWLT